ncbi:unnamed protein product [Periconia digitata]|uniref:Uncharacterized protein n=1 Tax=Periconia digitata TaxID=1303443 RepID=A0A9W4UED5_9PLEO|nr:unnamed protein product [Periconia digitata]
MLSWFLRPQPLPTDALKMTINLSIAIVCSMLWPYLSMAVPADPTVTSPAILPRQADSDFVGWLSYDNTWSSVACKSGLTWYQEGDYAQCCPDTETKCNAPTACADGSQIYPLATTTITTACALNYKNEALSICNSVFIYESFGDPNPKTDIVCGKSSVNWTYYRQIPSTATSQSDSQSQSSSPTSAPTQTESPDPQSQEHPSKTPKTWIIGIVVGPLAGISLAVVLLFCLFRRNRQSPHLPRSGSATMVPSQRDAKPHGMAQGTPYVGHQDSSPTGGGHTYHRQ